MATEPAKHVMHIKADRRGFTRITLDGKELENVTQLHFRAARGHVEVKLTFQHLEVEIETEVGEPKVTTTETTTSYEAGWK